MYYSSNVVNVLLIKCSQCIIYQMLSMNNKWPLNQSKFHWNWYNTWANNWLFHSIIKLQWNVEMEGFGGRGEFSRWTEVEVTREGKLSRWQKSEISSKAVMSWSGLELWIDFLGVGERVQGLRAEAQGAEGQMGWGWWTKGLPYFFVSCFLNLVNNLVARWWASGWRTRLKLMMLWGRFLQLLIVIIRTF